MSIANLDISGRVISDLTSPLIVVELGINHDGSLNKAKDMVRKAKASGAEAIKTQIHIPPEEMTQDALLVKPTNADASIFEVIEKAALTLDEERTLRDFIFDEGLLYIATPFSIKALDFLCKIKPDALKIGSGEIDHALFVREVASRGFPVIASTGMHAALEIRASVEELQNCQGGFALLQCTNAYPCPPEATALKGIEELRDLYSPNAIGFSDHSEGITIAIAALALGAQIIEKHFVTDLDAIGPDVSSSMNPQQLCELLRASKDVYSALQRNKTMQPEEATTYRFARSSVFAKRKIIKGERLTLENIWAKRPGTGDFAAAELPDLLGLRALDEIEAGQFLPARSVAMRPSYLRPLKVI